MSFKLSMIGWGGKHTEKLLFWYSNSLPPFEFQTEAVICKEQIVLLVLYQIRMFFVLLLNST